MVIVNKSCPVTFHLIGPQLESRMALKMRNLPGHNATKLVLTLLQSWQNV